MKACEPAPTIVRFFAGDETKDVPVPKVRKRWAGIVEIADQISWTHAELLDNKGRTLPGGIVQNEEPAGDLVDLHDGTRAREDRLLELMLKAQDRVLSHNREELKQAMSALTTMADRMSGAMAVMSKAYERALAVTQEAAAVAVASAPAAAEDTPQSKKLLELMAPEMIKRVMAEMFPGGGGNAAGPNGHDKPKT